MNEFDSRVFAELIEELPTCHLRDEEFAHYRALVKAMRMREAEPLGEDRPWHRRACHLAESIQLLREELLSRGEEVTRFGCERESVEEEYVLIAA
jgi:hypothetical protein